MESGDLRTSPDPSTQSLNFNQSISQSACLEEVGSFRFQLDICFGAMLSLVQSVELAGEVWLARRRIQG